MTTDPDLAGLREKAEKASTGPWEAGSRTNRGVVPISTYLTPGLRLQLAEAAETRDGDYIAAVSPDVLLALIARAEKAEGAVARVRAVVAEWRDDTSSFKPENVGRILIDDCADDITTALGADS